jgi:hypothetical protein
MTAQVGILAPLVSKPDQAESTSSFLLKGYELVVETEPLTLQWFAVKYDNSTTYAIFDTFATDVGRQVHLNGKVAEALGASAAALLSVPPKIGTVNVLASKVQPGTAVGMGVKAGLEKGLRVLITAKEEKIDAVRKFLIVRLPLV